MSETPPRYGDRYQLSLPEREALQRLIAIAEGGEAPNSIAAEFLLAWRNAEELGGFNVAHLAKVDASIAADMMTVCKLIIDTRASPDALGYTESFDRLTNNWRFLRS
jgi:hypothetical protein